MRIIQLTIIFLLIFVEDMGQGRAILPVNRTRRRTQTPADEDRLFRRTVENVSLNKPEDSIFMHVFWRPNEVLGFKSSGTDSYHCDVRFSIALKLKQGYDVSILNWAPRREDVWGSRGMVPSIFILGIGGWWPSSCSYCLNLGERSPGTQLGRERSGPQRQSRRSRE
jgi:hypothetical protein